MSEILDLIGKLDAPIAVAICIMFGWRIIVYFRAELERERTEKAEVIEELRNAHADRLTDKDQTAADYRETIVRIEKGMTRFQDARAVDQQALARIARKVGAEA